PARKHGPGGRGRGGAGRRRRRGEAQRRGDDAELRGRLALRGAQRTVPSRPGRNMAVRAHPRDGLRLRQRRVQPHAVSVLTGRDHSVGKKRCDPTTVAPLGTGCTAQRSAISRWNSRNAAMSVSEIEFEPSSVSLTMWTKLTPSSCRKAAYRKLSGWRSASSANTFST